MFYYTDQLESFCGDKVLNIGEECDAGVFGDKCCTSDCKLTSKSVCSPKNGLCCLKNCQLAEKGTTCISGDDIEESECDGISVICKKKAEIFTNSKLNPIHMVSDGDRLVSKLQHCPKASCELQNRIPCNYSRPEHQCWITCIDSNDNCVPLLHESKRVPKPIGYPCRSQTGVCSESGKCLRFKKKTQIYKDLKLSSVLLNINETITLVSSVIGFSILLLFLKKNTNHV
ncbi:Disintegrin and metalloproteinase domain-containing protein 17 [Thelohanellus kitauei]|uniref:Disintegrin and metalloproteinase domain-containing protein 17 n=1 Tax=Thelohanellus kitauei TaxID=669202 RepID=A0A0C2IKU6_THEKT|nr:Disintegrin and metalloproteinase domain-containing protein 17 [Thelohanellus kitauei]